LQIGFACEKIQSDLWHSDPNLQSAVELIGGTVVVVVVVDVAVGADFCVVNNVAFGKFFGTKGKGDKGAG